LRKYLRAFADLVSSGALFRYFAWNWRFGVYTLFPFVMLLVFAAIGLAVGGLVWSLEMPLSAPLAGPLSGPLAGAAGLLAGSLAFVLCIVVLGRRWPVLHLMDLWSFSVDFLHGRRSDAEALFG